MSAKPCRDCGRLVVFAKDRDGQWQVLDVSTAVWRQVGKIEGFPLVEKGPGLVSHHSLCGQSMATLKAERHFSEPIGGTDD